MENAAPLSDTLQRRIKDTRRLAIVGIGDELIPSDRLGMFAAQEIGEQQIPGVRIFFAGTVPESITGPLRRYQPGHVLFLDAADMGARPGTIAVIGPERVQASLISTHVLPLSVVMDYIERETGAGVTLLGLQPDLTGTDKDLSAEDLAYLGRNLLRVSQILRDR
jgi:hydrogenase 3 maturation protease